MKLLISIQIAPVQKIQYTLQVSENLKTKVDHLQTFDFDNHSDALMVKYAMDLIEKAEKTAIIISQWQNASLKDHGVVISFLTKLSRLKMQPPLILVASEDPILLRLVKIASRGNYLQEENLAKKETKLCTFFKNPGK